MSVRAKFRVMGINHVYTGAQDKQPVDIRLAPVWEQDGVNRKWSQATPSGEIKMLITNPEAADQFELGREYFVDFTPA